MSRGATIFLVVLALGAAVFVALYVPLSRDARKPVGSPLFTFDPGEVRNIKITNGDRVVELKKSESGWLIGPDPEDRASVNAVKLLLETARSIPVLDRIDGNELDGRDQLGEYGLKKSSVQFDIRGDSEEPLMIGKDAADDKRVYARFEDSHDVYLIPDDLVRMILSPAEDYRDRMPVRLRPDRVERVVIQRPAGEMELRRDASGWVLVKPLSAPASTEAVEAFLDKLFRTRIEGFESTSDPAAFGLAEPLAEVRAYGEGEDTPESIRIGRQAPDGTWYTGLLPRKIIARLPSSVMELLAVDPTTFRDRSLARMNMDLVDLIRVATPAGVITIRRSEGGWTSDRGKVSEAAVQRLVGALAEARASRYASATPPELEKAGLLRPERVVGFYSVTSENTPESTAGEHLIKELQFGSQGGEVAVYSTGSPEIAFTSDPVLESLPPDPSGWAAP